MMFVCIWLAGQYAALESFETHVDEAILGVTKDVQELKTEITGIRDDLREDTLYINQRIDRINGRLP